MEMVTVNQCGALIRYVWINRALVHLSELQSQLESQKASREQKEDVCTASAKVRTAGSVAASRE
jgi:hypothetical protein